MRRNKIGNPQLDSTVSALRRASKVNKVLVWKKVAEYLERPRSERVTVNIGEVSKTTEAGEVVVVPGKVLGSGLLDHKVAVGGYSFSASASEKIREAGGKVLTLEELVQMYPAGKGVRLIVS